MNMAFLERLNYAEMKLDEAIRSRAADIAYWRGYRDGMRRAVAEEKGRSQGCEFCHEASYTKKPFNVITQAGSIVAVQFKCCPSCGRKLEGTE